MKNNVAYHDPFFAANQKYLNWFAFFSVFPLIKIAGISITFFIFLIIVYKFLGRKKKLFKITQWTDIFLILFLIFVFISWVLTEESFRERSIFSILKIMLQYTYWVVLALFVKTYIYQFSFYRLSRSVFFATIATIIYYMTFNHIYPIMAPNAFAYIVVTAMPIGFYYVMKRFPLFYAMLIGIGFVMGVLFSGSRAGTSLLLFELFLILGIGNKKLKKISMVFIVFLIPLVMIFSLYADRFNVGAMKYALADMLENYSPKIAYTLRMEENVFERDKSWLIRELMWQKGQKIFEEHPFFGIGPGNFTKYYTQLDIASVSKWLHRSESSYNTTSSQNSYLMILTENGIFAFSSLLIVFLIILWKGFYYVRSFRDNAEVYIYIPFIALLFYGFILVTTMGTLFWLFLGLALTLTQRKRHLS